LKGTRGLARWALIVSALNLSNTIGVKDVEDPVSIDVVIPSLRVGSCQLDALTRLDTPSGVTVRYIVVVDRTTQEVPRKVLEELRGRGIHVVLNGANLGAHASRNQGFSAGSGDYVLFLDDDTTPDPSLLRTYVNELRAHPEAPGFVGKVGFPPPVDSFTRGIVASDILTFFDIADHSESLTWGVSANLMVKRQAADGISFSTVFPKGGGGEDIDYCLRLVQRAGARLRAVPKARITHPWWTGGRKSYRRFARWAYGDSRLPAMHPAYRFWTPPNCIETLTVGTPVLVWISLLMGFSPIFIVLWIALVLCLEFTAELVRLTTRYGAIKPRIAAEATTVRLANDLGRIGGNLRRGRLWGLTERFDYFTTGEHIHYERAVAMVKFALFGAATLILLVFIPRVT
jgi:glycosyltransferase involved in cell wall biosynthesis